MRQGWRRFAGASLALGLMVAPLGVAITTDVDAATKSKPGYHQFTGTVTALDKSTITVEKRGKNPRSVVFTRHADMKSDGDVAKSARVTVYYRDEGGKSIAHKVVVKPTRARASAGGN